MKNFVSSGDTLQIVAGSGGVTGGKVTAVGKVIGVPVTTAVEGELVTINIKGIYRDVTKAASEAWVIGDMLYLKADGSELTKTATSNIFAGYAAAAAASSDVLGEILLSH